MINLSKTIASALTLTFLGACSAKYTAQDISSSPAGAPISGIPFRTMESYKVHLLAWDADKQEYIYVRAEEKAIASPEKVYTLGFDAELLAKHDFSVTQRADGTLNVVSLTSESKVNATVDELTGLTDAYTTYKKEQQTAAEAEAEKAKTDAATLATGEITYQKSLDVVRLAEHKLAMAQRSFDIMLARGGNTPEEIIAKRTEIEEARIALRTAQIDANVAAQAAGRLELPYPGVYL